MSNGLSSILEAGSVAVVGASADHKKRGYQAVRALLESRYAGEVMPVHPDGGELLGLPVSRSVTELARTPDLALLCTRADSAPAVLEECAAKGIGGAVIIAVGFGESGPQGEALERAVRDIARRTGIRIIGPNTSGFLNAGLGLNLVGIPNVRPGRMALLSQSGNIGLEIITKVSGGAHGISLYVGVGAELDVGYHEYLDFLEHHDESRVILVYAEGFRDGRAFMRSVERVGRAKPIVVLKGGRTADGATSARSHTGAIAGSYDVFRALLWQSGAYEVRRSDELLRVGEMLAGQPAFRAPGVVVLADGGGHATLAADALEDLGVPLAFPSRRTVDRLSALLGSTAAVTNPIDLAGAADGTPGVFASVLEILAEDPRCGGVVLTGLFGGYALRFSASLADEEATAASQMVEIARDAGLPFLAHTIYAAEDTAALRQLRVAGVPVLESLEVACSCAAAAHARRAFLERSAVERGTVEAPGAAAGCGPDSETGTEVGAALSELEVRRLIAAEGVPVVPCVLACSEEECADAVARLSGRAVVKVLSAAIPHKTDAGGVALDVTRRGAAAAYRRVVGSATAYAESEGIDPRIEGVLVSPMLPKPLTELIVGLRCDPQFGLVITVGSGGTHVEILKDVAIRGLPVDARTVSEMLDELRTSPLINGFRGSQPADRVPFIELVLGLARCILANPRVHDIELNPVMVYPSHVVAVDARAFVRDTVAE